MKIVLLTFKMSLDRAIWCTWSWTRSNPICPLCSHSMDGHFSIILFLLKNRQKSDSFAAHFEQHFDSTKSRSYLRKYTAFKVVQQLKPIGAMKTYTKSNYNLCTEERLTILRKLRDKRVKIMNKNSDLHGACWHKTTFHRFFLSTDDPVFNG